MEEWALEVVTYAEEEALNPSVPAINEGLDDSISTCNPLASLFAKEILKFPPILCNFLLLSFISGT